MGKNNINVPGKMPFSTVIPVRITDMNYGGHLGNDSFLTIAHEARIKFLQSIGYSELNFGGVGLIMSDVAVDYKAEIKYGDSIEVQLGIGEIGRVHFDLIYQVYAERDQKRFLAANMRTGMVCFDYVIKKVRPIPDAVLAKFSDIQL
jgi:YbgC/YbaW family acyl-CoA thioester hydrolase